MKKVIINENQKGFLFHNGRFVKLLGAGKYPLFGAREIEIVSLKEPLMSAKCELDTLLANSEVAKLTSVCEVADQQLALHYTSGKFDGVLRRGKYAFWSVLERHEYQLVDISTPEVAEDVPQYIFAKLPTTVYTKVEVAQYQKARLYFDQKLIRILDAGTYYFWKNNIRVDVNLVDTRLTRMEITGQEIMTQDTGGRETGPLKESWGSCAGLAERSMYMPGRGVHTAVSPKEKSTVPAPCAGQNPVMSTAIGTKRLFYPPNSKWMRDTHAERRSTG